MIQRYEWDEMDDTIKNDDEGDLCLWKETRKAIIYAFRDGWKRRGFYKEDFEDEYYQCGKEVENVMPDFKRLEEDMEDV